MLANDERNACVGCGPANLHGLRLAFRRTGTHVEADFTASAAHEGWPGRLHSAFLYLALTETANWTLYGNLDRVGLPVETGALGLKRWVATGEPLTVRGRLVEHSATTARVETDAVDRDGQVVATLARAYALPGRAEFLKRMGYDAVPAGLEDAIPPE